MYIRYREKDLSIQIGFGFIFIPLLATSRPFTFKQSNKNFIFVIISCYFLFSSSSQFFFLSRKNFGEIAADGQTQLRVVTSFLTEFRCTKRPNKSVWNCPFMQLYDILLRDWRCALVERKLATLQTNDFIRIFRDIYKLSLYLWGVITLCPTYVMLRFP